MISEEILEEIRKATEEMDVQELYRYITTLDVEIDYSDIDTCIEYAARLVREMQTELESGEWYGYQLKALNALEKLPTEEYDIIGIDAYDFPYEIKDAEKLLEVLRLV